MGNRMIGIYSNQKLFSFREKNNIQNEPYNKKFFTAASVEEDQNQTSLVEINDKNDISPADFVASLATDEEVVAYYNAGIKKKENKLQENVVQIRRVTKVVKGGKQLSFRAVVVIGDKRGQVSVGNASAKEVIGAVAKAVAQAKRNLLTVPVTKTHSIPHYVEGRYGASHVVLRPAREGTGVVSGGASRVVLELAGIRNIYGKQLGAKSPLNNAWATFEGLKALRTLKYVAEQRSVRFEQLIGKREQ